MTPLCAEQLDRLRQNFDGRVHLVYDWGDTILVIVDPKDRGPFPETSDPQDAWKRIDEPTMVLIDPARAGYPRVVN